MRKYNPNKLSKRQIKGIHNSLQKKWIPSLKDRDIDLMNASNCKLCRLYDRGFNPDKLPCSFCPIYLKTGKRVCKNTPWEIIANIYIKIRFSVHCGTTWENTKHKITKRMKLNEIRFLISLLPKKEQKQYITYLPKK
jgi:hypothetical protein